MNEIQKAKKAAELTRKMEREKRDLKYQTEQLGRIQREGGNTTPRSYDVKIAAERLEKTQKEIQRLK